MKIKSDSLIRHVYRTRPGASKFNGLEGLSGGEKSEDGSVDKQGGKEYTHPGVKLAVGNWLDLFFNPLLCGKQFSDQPEWERLFNLIFLKYHDFS